MINIWIGEERAKYTDMQVVVPVKFTDEGVIMGVGLFTETENLETVESLFQAFTELLATKGWQVHSLPFHSPSMPLRVRFFFLKKIFFF